MEPSRSLVLGTAGHIDHGKTALVQALTGEDTDRLPAEKLRGITIDLGFAAINMGSMQLAMVDVPGHERFIRNMLAGATGLDLALLVVAADDSVMPQTREHLEILRLLELTGGVVAITKCDLADAGWIDMVEDDVRSLVAGSFLEGAAVIRTSIPTGQGIDDLRAELASLAHRSRPHSDAGMFRMAIDRSFTLPGRGTIVTGTVASGEATIGEELEWFPEGRSVRIRGLHRHGSPVDRVHRGERAAINLGGVHHAEVFRGQELGSPGYLKPTRLIGVEIKASPAAPRKLRHRGRYRLHLGTAEVAATLSLFGRNSLDPGDSSLAQLILSQPVVAVSGQPFVIREESPPATLGGGRILQPTARRIRRRDSSAIQLLERRGSADPHERIASALTTIGLAPWADPDLCREAGVPIAEVPAEVAHLTARGSLVELPIGPRRTVRVVADVAIELEGRVLRAIGRLHAAHPRHSAVRRAHVLAALPDLPGDALIAGLIERLKARGDLIADDRFVALRSFEPQLSHSERKLKAELARLIRDGGSAPPEEADLIATTSARKVVVLELLKLLVEEGVLISLGDGLYLDSAVESSMRMAVRSRLASSGAITMAELRDLLGTTRKYAVPIGEHLDRIGLTHRVGDLRTLGAVDEESSAHE
ncbi:MAG: selB [Planctomycetota bacterium]|nr:selB [Planctomycetota bacterium]